MFEKLTVVQLLFTRTRHVSLAKRIELTSSHPTVLLSTSILSSPWIRVSYPVTQTAMLGNLAADWTEKKGRRITHKVRRTAYLREDNSEVKPDLQDGVMPRLVKTVTLRSLERKEIGLIRQSIM
jgi:hypothetical protein